MKTKYGFGGGLSLPAKETIAQRPSVSPDAMSEAVEAGNKLGFVSRDPPQRRKPGPKRREPQDKISIPGPKRVTDRFRAFCVESDLTYWEALETLLDAYEASGKKGRGDGSA